MDVNIADAILDWLDPDDTPRENGAEVDYYAAQNPPYAPKNGPLDTIEELLLVRGVTPELLFEPTPIATASSILPKKAAHKLPKAAAPIPK